MKENRTLPTVVLLLLVLAALLVGGCAPTPVYAGPEEATAATPPAVSTPVATATPVTVATPTAAATPEATPLPEDVTASIRAWGRQDPAALRAQIFPERAVSLPAVPVTLTIPAIGVDAAVESVGRTADGAMDIPRQAQNGAWYRLGAAPGQEGTAVIAGHLDTARGGPAVFYELGDLRPGDEIQVTDSDGITHTFAVDRVARYAYDDAPLAQIFGFQPGAHLNLITCAGSWNRAERSYSERLVVFTTLVGE